MPMSGVCARARMCACREVYAVQTIPPVFARALCSHAVDLSQYKLVMTGTAASHELPCRVPALLQAQPQKLLVSMCAAAR